MTKIRNKMYNGEVELVFETYRHQYSVDGEVIDSVTKILDNLPKHALIYWSANMAAEYVRNHLKPGVALDEVEIEQLYERARKAHTQKKVDASGIGSLVHKWCESYINKNDPGIPVNEQVRGAVKRFISWEKEHSVNFLLAEQPIYSRRHQYAGTTDFICKIDGKMWLGDIKTSNGIYDSYYAQAAAYLQARVEEFPNESYAGIVVVRVGKQDGELEIGKKTNNELLPYQKLFMACKNINDVLKEIKQNKVK